MLNTKTAIIALIVALGGTSVAMAQDNTSRDRDARVYDQMQHLQTPLFEGRSVAVGPSNSSPVPNSMDFLGNHGVGINAH